METIATPSWPLTASLKLWYIRNCGFYS